jgi:hypothetical protein
MGTTLWMKVGSPYMWRALEHVQGLGRFSLDLT